MMQENLDKQDPVSTMQKTGRTDDSSFLVCPGLEEGIAYGCDRKGAINSHFSVYLAIFGMVSPNQPNKQPGDPKASLLLTSEKALFCNLNQGEQ